jgi:hypothetical protein
MQITRPIGISIFAIGLFLCSLFLPVFLCASKSFIGYEVLAMGWMGVLGLDPRWFANIGFILLIWRSMHSQNAAPWLIAVTAVFAIASLLPAAGCAAPGGAPGTSKGLALGGYVWLAAMLSACWANLMSVATTDVDNQALATVKAHVDAAVTKVLLQVRAGQPINANCPSCSEKIVVSTERTPSDAKTKVNTNCKCGACNGNYNVTINTA